LKQKNEQITGFQ